MPKILPVLLAAAFMLSFAGQALAQDDCAEDDCEDCTSCRTKNYYYVLAAAIIIFAVFFWWTNRNKPPKVPKKTILEEHPDNKEG